MRRLKAIAAGLGAVIAALLVAVWLYWWIIWSTDWVHPWRIYLSPYAVFCAAILVAIFSVGYRSVRKADD